MLEGGAGLRPALQLPFASPCSLKDQADFLAAGGKRSRMARFIGRLAIVKAHSVSCRPSSRAASVASPLISSTPSLLHHRILQHCLSDTKIILRLFELAQGFDSLVPSPPRRNFSEQGCYYLSATKL